MYLERMQTIPHIAVAGLAFHQSINHFAYHNLRSCISDVYIACEYYVGSAMSYGLPARNTQQRGRAILRGDRAC